MKIKALSSSYRSLQYLADWMQVGTSPIRWASVKRSQHGSVGYLGKMRITLLDYIDKRPLVVSYINTFDHLKEALATEPENSIPTRPRTDTQCLKLFVVEDLSRMVIEMLGTRFGIDPLFFREQIEDSNWQGVRDPWATLPNLTSNTKRRQWFRLLNVRLRYHRTAASFNIAQQQAGSWNVRRQPEDDGNHFEHQGGDGAIVSILRTRTTIWVGNDKACSDAPVGIVLVDPTIAEGRALWYDRSNWLPMPAGDTPNTCSLVQPDFANHIVHMTREYPWYRPHELSDSYDLGRIVLPSLYTVCAEWNLVTEYIKTRLSQIELELQRPRHARTIDAALARLDTWRRTVPCMRENVKETLDEALPAAQRLIQPSQANEALDDITVDFKRVLCTLDTLQGHINRLSERGNAEMQLAAARESLAESHNLARLTWLATIFVPLTFVTGLFSMTDDLGAILGTVRVYFSAAIPVAIGSLVVARWGSNVYRKMGRWIEHLTRM
jgi:hypothetical protein